LDRACWSIAEALTATMAGSWFLLHPQNFLFIAPRQTSVVFSVLLSPETDDIILEQTNIRSGTGCM
jgi:hypothetical protein